MTASTKMEKLVKGLDFSTTDEYYNYIIESFYNGQPSQAYTLFTDMPVTNRKELVKELVSKERHFAADHKILQLIDRI